jgi:hypothetical protein
MAGIGIVFICNTHEGDRRKLLEITLLRIQACRIILKEIHNEMLFE